MKPLVALLLTVAMLTGCWAPHQKTFSITADVLELGGVAAAVALAPPRGSCDDPDFCSTSTGEGVGLFVALIGVLLQPFVLYHALHDQ